MAMSELSKLWQEYEDSHDSKEQLKSYIYAKTGHYPMPQIKETADGDPDSERIENVKKKISEFVPNFAFEKLFQIDYPGEADFISYKQELMWREYQNRYELRVFSCGFMAGEIMKGDHSKYLDPRVHSDTVDSHIWTQFGPQNRKRIFPDKR